MLSRSQADHYGAVIESARAALPARATKLRDALPLVGAFAGIVYPALPPLLYRLASGPAAPVPHALAVAAGILAVFAVPLAGLAFLWVSAGANDVRALRFRGIGMLLVIAPVLTALGTTVTGYLGLRSVAAPIWLGFWMLAGSTVFWRSAVPGPLMSPAVTRALRRTHRAFIVLLIGFVVLHLAVNLTALRNLASYNEAAGWFRFIWRTPVGEPILIALLAIQMGTGLGLAVDVGAGRSTFEHLCQIAAGLLIAVFLTSHTFAVAVLGRGQLDRGPDFTFASAGPLGVLGSAQGATLFPYYGLAVLAVFVHLARPLRLFALRRLGTAGAPIPVTILIVAAFVLSALLLTALANPGA
jgi:hypothetical protein